MKEYMKYADDYLFFKLHQYLSEIEECEKARNMIPDKSFLAYLSLTAAIKRLQKKADAVRAVLAKRGYSRKDIVEKTNEA